MISQGRHCLNTQGVVQSVNVDLIYTHTSMNKLISLIFALLIYSTVAFACDSGSSFNFSQLNQTGFFESNVILPEGYDDYTLHWNLGDGTFSILPDPVHTYNGTEFSVCLTITFISHDGSCEELICQDLEFDNGVNCQVQADFGWVEDEGVILAEDLSSSGFFTTFEDRAWSVNGVWVGDAISLEVTIPDPAVYEVCLLVMGDAYSQTCQSTKCESIEVIGEMPVWMPQFDLTSTGDCRFRFTDFSVLPEGVEMEDRTWLINGEPISESSEWLHHHFLEPGLQEISLEVTWSWAGGQEQSTITETVETSCEEAPSQEEAIKWQVQVIGQQITVNSKKEQVEAPMLTLYDLSGREVWRGNAFHVQLSELSAQSGYYVLSVEDGFDSTSKIIYLP